MEQKYIIAIYILLIILIVWGIYRAKESFDPDMKYELKQSDLPITPKYIEPELKMVTDASDFAGMPDKIYPPWGNAVVNYGPVDLLDKGDNEDAGLGFNFCSKSCCAPQYPPPFVLPDDDLVKKSKNKYVNTSYACNNAWQDSGCVCMTDKQGKFLASRGGNSHGPDNGIG